MNKLTVKKNLYRGMDFYKGSMKNFISEVYDLSSSKYKYPKLVVTPNPEMVVEMNKNSEFANVLQSVDYRLADGFGLWFLLKYFWGCKFLYRICGSDLMQEILNKNTQDDLKIYLLGAKEGVAASIAEMYPSSNIVGFDSPIYSEDESENEIICQKIVNSEADLLFVAFGAPKQELWMWKNKEKLEGVKFVFGVGGAFDFIAGEVSRAPAIMRKYVGLEWLYRLIKNPLQRSKRIWNAVFVFPCIFMKDFFREKLK